ncbi:MAG: tetratricopeptide repeat protein [Cyanobacteria bacterium P01_G01_bin.49]
MNRVVGYKIGYLVVLFALMAIATALILSLGGGTLTVLVVAGIFFIPGRIQGIFYRKMFRGRRLLNSGRAAEAQQHFESFLRQLNEQPWLKKLLWLSWSIYTPNVEAMTLNNLGTAYLQLGQFSEAESAFKQALEVDPLYPIPYVNIAILREMEGNRLKAEQAIATAVRLGYSGGTVDAVIHSAQSLLAHVEGLGRS